MFIVCWSLVAEMNANISNVEQHTNTLLTKLTRNGGVYHVVKYILCWTIFKMKVVDIKLNLCLYFCFIQQFVLYSYLLLGWMITLLQNMACICPVWTKVKIGWQFSWNWSSAFRYETRVGEADVHNLSICQFALYVYCIKCALQFIKPFN
jgi:hypothetical protein